MAPLGPSPLAPLRLPTAFESEWTQKYQWASGVNIGTYRSRFPKLDEPVVDQQPSVEQPQQEEPPAEIQNITPEKEEVNGEDPVNHNEEKEKDASGDSDLETDLQELAEAKTGGKGGDGPDVREEFASNTEPVEMPEAGRNMSGQVASTLGPTKQDCSQVDEPVVDQQPSVEQPQQEKPPAESQDITPRKEEVHGEDPVNRDEEEEKDPFEDSGLEADLQQLALAKTGGEGGDGPDVREEFASNTEPGEMPEAGCILLLDILLNV
ncbi:neurofilament medium polypeptide-like isoform X1 [Bos indicus]|uniref:Neurofilament medium polypeptide-like isoform X1 n=2 Tax=Bos TaxID=9903 RepID=A0ABM4S0U7_BOSIN|nr:neurofilament medium polypeptide-like isoform X1 [Bos indicus x Bos taurus]